MNEPRGEAAVRAAFRAQAEACRALGSPFTAGLCDLLATDLARGQGPVAARVLGWQGDPAGRADSVPLRLCGALHALVLSAADKELGAGYARRNVPAVLLRAALARHAGFVLEWLESPPQTNEVARSAAIIAAARFLSQLSPLPMRVLELGASAGLNLNFPLYHLAPQGAPPPAACGDVPRDILAKAKPQVVLTPHWSGAVPEGAPLVAEARGVDLRPVDARADALRLMAYCWADQEARLARLKAALELARSSPPRVDQSDAAAWLEAALARPEPGRLTLVFHTVAAQYFPAETQVRCEAALQRAGAFADSGAAVAHFAMEADGGEGAGLSLRLWDGGLRAWDLGRADFHGRWVRWSPRAS